MVIKVTEWWHEGLGWQWATDKEAIKEAQEAVDEFIEVLSRGNLSLAALQPYLAKLYEDDKTISPEPLPPFSVIATNDDSMDFLAEMGMITPVTNSTGEILISPSNEIYSL